MGELVEVIDRLEQDIKDVVHKIICDEPDWLEEERLNREIGRLSVARSDRMNALLTILRKELDITQPVT